MSELELDRSGVRTVSVSGQRGGQAFSATDAVAEEVPIALEFNGISHAVMLATPLDLEDFALGFSLSEGILESPSELYGVEESESEAGITLRLEVASASFMRLKERRRSLAGRTGCGLCGTENLSQVARCLTPNHSTQRWSSAAVARSMSQLGARQALQKLTGATHAAAWVTEDGDIGWLREDVGRHNALDKLVGALARHKVQTPSGFIAITSRASFEMVQKAASAGVSLLAAVSAPTSLAVETAQRAGLTLIGFARQHDFVAYSHAERIDNAH